MIKEVYDPLIRQQTTQQIIEALPEWFGIPQANPDYIHDAKEMMMFAYFLDDQPIGFVSLKPNNESTIEIHVMGILKEHHRQGIGKMLIDYVCHYAKAEHYQLLEVKTLDASHTDANYAKTRDFYLSMGFIPVETFKELWGTDNPCLLLIKTL
ncbi:MAG: GNAT family N-acetyltransferase [Tenericutes bacterium]|nr:GNAT family N-acetyltransferase [Mycoplasmatota bacterium]